ncbi:PLAC8-like protein 1 isoform X1 [Anarrhichthys ocellatus]|uniref:PLAC8-like protein 1 isoform X1 n=1 Tax=Anarrhichthys ocellatus TaxID=433405 RepID=UPI0012ECDA3F|nr:PLAC8-like protein 1 isoform X1 [Anarrhichthys ocellatus]
MEQLTVTHQPRPSVTRGSASAFQEEEVGGFTTGSKDDLRSNSVPAVTDPALTQPGLGITTTTITTITQTGGDWSTGLFDVCGDKTTCNTKTQTEAVFSYTLSALTRQSELYDVFFVSFFVLSLVFCPSQANTHCSHTHTHTHTHTHCAYPVLAGVLGALVPCCLDLSLAHQYGECLCMPLLPGSTFAMRVGIRERYKIRGSVCEDWTTVYCCYPLAVCQMIREMKRRMKTLTYHVSTALEC